MIELTDKPFTFASDGLSLRFRPRRRRSVRPPGQTSARYPYDYPNKIVYKELDQVGRALIKEINLHPWMDSTDYCAGHPPDRPANESTPVSLSKAGNAKLDSLRWNFFKELTKLKQRGRAKKINPEKFHVEAQRLLDRSRSRFCLNLNVYAMPVFLGWARQVEMEVGLIFDGKILPHYQPPAIRLNPGRPGLNVTWTFEFYSAEERRVFHQILLDTLRMIPI